MQTTANLHFKSKSGFSLVELMIASAIGLFLISAIAQVFTQSRATLVLNQSVTEMQDRGRSLLHHLSFNLMQRGHQGCLPPLSLDITDIDSIDWDNVATVDPLATRRPQAPYPITSLRGFEVSESGLFIPTPAYEDLEKIQNGATNLVPRPNSDVIHVEFGDRHSVPLLTNMSSAQSALEISNNLLNFTPGDLIMISDCFSADIVEITQVIEATGLVTLEHSAAANRSDRLSRPYATNATVRKFHSFTYFVAASGRKTSSSIDIYSLYRANDHLETVELADGVDFLHISYKQQTTLGVQDLSADHAQFNPMRVIGIDLGVLVVGLKDVLHKNDTKTYHLPGSAIGPTHRTTYEPNKMLKTPFSRYVDFKNRA